MSKTKTPHIPAALLVLLFGLYLFHSGPAIAAEGRASVYKIGPLITPNPETVTLKDLDTSGFLSGPYLIISTEGSSRYDYPAYSAQGDFLYAPVPWNYYNIAAEGLKFDQASLYYYYTSARKYLETRFGLKQSLDGYNIDRLRIIMFHENGSGAVEGLSRGIDPRKCIIITGVPGDPGTNPLPNFYPNGNRSFSIPMHEYAHLVFLRYRQGLQFQQDNPQAIAINEGLSVFWPCTIMDEPRYNNGFWPTQMPAKLVDLRNAVKYDPNNIPGDKRLRNNILSLATTLWKLREHPRIGKTNAEKIIYEAMALIPHRNATLADVSGACYLAQAAFPSLLRDNLRRHVTGVFAKNNIPQKIGQQTLFLTFLEEGNSLPAKMRARERRTVTIVFKNQLPQAGNAPYLVSFNPQVNPNADNPGVITNYAWGISGPLPPSAVAGDRAVFCFSITAPAAPGKYACDWAIKSANGTTSYVVSKDILVTP